MNNRKRALIYRHLSKTAASIALILLCVRAGAVVQETEPPVRIPDTCAFSEPANIVNAMRDAPAIADEFRRQRIAIADRGEPYRAFDVVDRHNAHLPDRQFVRAYRFGHRWVIWYVRGGFGTAWHVREMEEYRETPDGPVQLRMTFRTLGGEPCRATQALLDGVVSPNGY